MEQRRYRDPLDPLHVGSEHLLPMYMFPRHEIIRLCDELCPHLERRTRRAHALPAHTQVLAARRFFASGSLNVIGDCLNRPVECEPGHWWDTFASRQEDNEEVICIASSTLWCQVGVPCYKRELYHRQKQGRQPWYCQWMLHSECGLQLYLCSTSPCMHWTIRGEGQPCLTPTQWNKNTSLLELRVTKRDL